MAQLVFKIEVAAKGVYEVVKRIGDFNTATTVPRIDETILLVDSQNYSNAFKIYDIEYVYGDLGNETKLLQVCLYVTQSEPRDKNKYLVRKERRPIAPKLRIAS